MKNFVPFAGLLGALPATAQDRQVSPVTGAPYSAITDRFLNE